MVAYKRYTNFFPQGKGNLLQSSGVNASGPNRYMSSIIPEGKKSDKIRGFGQKIGARNGYQIPGRSLADHFIKLQMIIDKQLWLFISAMAYHAKMSFRKNFEIKAFGQGTPWRHLRRSTIKKRKKLGLWGGGILVATGRLRNSLDVIEADGNTKNKGRVSSTVHTNPVFFKDAYPETLNHGRKKNKPYKDEYGEITIGGNTYYGRKGRVYAGVHNERSVPGAPWRQFMGFPTEKSGDFMFAKEEMELMDDYLFFGVFNRSKELGELSPEKRRERNIYKGRKSANEESKAQIDMANSTQQMDLGFGDEDLGEGPMGDITMSDALRSLGL